MSIESIPGEFYESEVTFLSQGTLIKGTVYFDKVTRVHGRIEGKVFGLKGSLLVLAETASIHGEIEADEVIIDGFVHGNIKARKISVSESGRLIGDVEAEIFEVKFGAFFHGKAFTQKNAKPLEQIASDLTVLNPN